MIEAEKLVLTVTEAGALLGISRVQAYKMANEGIIPVIRFGRRMVVPKVALLKMLENAGVESKAYEGVSSE